MITYRRATPEDVRPALDLALKVFIEFETPGYEPIAIVNFKKDCIDNQFYTDSPYQATTQCCCIGRWEIAGRSRTKRAYLVVIR